PVGHPDLATSLINLGGLHWERGESTLAEPLVREALAIYQALRDRVAGTAAEAEALNYAACLPLARDAYLSITPGRSAADASDLLRQSRRARTRIAERPHRALPAFRAPQPQQVGRQLQQQPERLARLFWSPRKDPAAHRQEVERLTAAKEDLEQRL